MKRAIYRLAFRLCAASALAVVALTGCGPPHVETGTTGERTLVEASADRSPNWITREPASDDEYHFFRGIRTDAPSLEAAEADARHNALAGIVQFLGLRVTVDYQRMRTEERTAIEDAIRSVGGADIAGTRLSEFYYRRWRVNEGDRVRYLYDGFVLVRLPKASVERIRQNQQERLRGIRQMLAGPGFMARPGEIYPQITSAAQALAAVNALNESVLVTTQTAGEAEQIRSQAITRLTRLIGAMQIRVAAEPRRVTSGAQQEPFRIRATVTIDDRGVPAPVPQVAVSLAFGSGDGALTQVVWTDQLGVATWDLHSVPFRGGSVPITARIQLPEGAQSLQTLATAAPTASGSVQIVDAASLVKILVLVRERVAGGDTDTHFAESRLVDALREAGFEVVAPGALPPGALTDDPWSSADAATDLAEQTGASMVLTGTIETTEPTPVARMQGVYFCTANVALVLTSVADHRAVASVALPDDVVRDSKGFGNTPERAAENALMLSRGRGRQPNGYTHIAEQILRAVSGGQ